MDFIVKNLEENIVNIARMIGYVIIDSREYNEYNMVRKLTYENYPRFHIYAKIRGDRFIVSLHLDQKQPSYKGSHAHGGEYEGPAVEDEADRIKEILKKS